MRSYIFQLPLLAATVAQAYIINVDVAPDQTSLQADLSTAKCYWSGTAPFCAGSCDDGYSECGTDGSGNGATCVTGYKKYCCRGGCSNSRASNGHTHTTDDPNDDFCPPGKRILCPPDAENNKQCECFDDKS